MKESSAVNLRDASTVSALFEQAAQTLRSSPLRQHSIVKLPARGRLLATGDLHDNPIHLQKIIALAKLDPSPDHHLVVHEIIHSERLVNGLDLSHRMLARVAELVIQFPTQVHPLLANHELAQMTGKGVSKGAGNSVELFNDGLEFVFGEDCLEVATAMNQFIAAMPLALLSESGLFCAHSLPAPRMMKHFDVNVLMRDLTPDDYVAPHGAAHLMVWGRGHLPDQIQELARQWNVKMFVLGHEHVEAGIDINGPNLVVLNSDHENGRVLPIDLTHIPTAEEALIGAIPLAAV